MFFLSIVRQRLNLKPVRRYIKLGKRLFRPRREKKSKFFPKNI